MSVSIAFPPKSRDKGLMSLKEQLKLIEEKRLDELKIQIFEEMMEQHPNLLGDHLQYALYKLLSKPVNVTNIYNDVVLKLIEVCYSPKLMAGLKSLQLFVGTINNLIAYFLNQGKCEEALNLLSVINRREGELEATTDPLIRKLLFYIHTTFVKFAVKYNGDECSKLLSASVKILRHYASSSDPDIASKVYKSFLYAVENVTVVDKELIICLKEASNFISFHSKQQAQNIFIVVYLNIICNQLLRGQKMDFQKINLKLKIYLILKGHENMYHQWKKFIEFFMKPTKNFSDQLISARDALNVLLKQDEDSFNLMLASTVMAKGIETWFAENNNELKNYIDKSFLNQFFQNFVSCVWQSSASFRSFTVKDSFSELRHVCLFESLGMLMYNTMALARFSLKADKYTSENYFEVVQKSYQWCLECIKGSLKNSCSTSSQDNMWNSFVIYAINFVETCLVIGSDKNEWTPLKIFSADVARVVSSAKRSVPVNDSRIQLLFDRWFYSCKKDSDWMEGMICSATQFLLRPQDLKEAVTNWALCKSNLVDQELLDMTFVEFLDKNDFDKTNRDNIAICLAELEAYENKTTFSSINVLNKLFDYIINSQASLLIKSKAVCSILVACVWTVSDVKLLDNFKGYCQTLLNEMENEVKNSTEKDVICGCLEFALFQCDLRISQNSSFKLETAIDSKANEGNEKNFQKPFETLTFDGLSMNNEKELLNRVRKAVSHWSSAVDRLVKTKNCGEIEVTSWLNQIESIANLANLYGDLRSCVKLWLLYYKLTTIYNLSSPKLNALSSLIDLCTPPLSSEIVITAENLAKTMLKSETPLDLNLIIRFYMALANDQLTRGDAVGASENLSKAKELLSKTDENWQYFTFNALYLYLTSKLACLDPKLFKTHQTGIIHVAFRASAAFRAVKHAFSSNSWPSNSRFRTSMLVNMFDIGLWCSRVYQAIGVTKFVKFCLSDLHTISQSLGFATRTAEITLCITDIYILSNMFPRALKTLDRLAGLLDITSFATLFSEDKSPKIDKFDRMKLSSPTNLFPTKKRVTPNCSCIQCVHAQIICMHAFTIYAYIQTFDKKEHISVDTMEKCRTRLNLSNYCRVINEDLRELFPGTVVNIYDHDIKIAQLLTMLTEVCMLANSNQVRPQIIVKAQQLLDGFSYDKSFYEWRLVELKLVTAILEEKLLLKEQAEIAPVQVNNLEVKVCTPKMSRARVNTNAPKKYDDDLVEPMESLAIGKRVNFDQPVQEDELSTKKTNFKPKKTPLRKSLTKKSPLKTLEKPLSFTTAPVVKSLRSRKVIETPSCSKKDDKKGKIPQNGTSIKTNKIVKPLNFDILLDDDDESTVALNKKTKVSQRLKKSEKKSRNDSVNSIDLFESFESKFKK